MKAEIKAEELMIGNWVQDEEGQFGMADRISSWEISNMDAGFSMEEGCNVLMKMGNDFIVPEKVYGIPLTTEILEKCGFTYSESLTLWKMEDSHVIYEYDESDEYSVNHFIHFYHNGRSVVVESTNDHGEYSNLMFKHIQYLHQLQNLYFSLTGTHLTIKL